MRQLKITNKITNRNATLDRYFGEIAKYEILSLDEELELTTLLYNTKDEKLKIKLRDRLVNSNLRFVVSVAKQYEQSDIPLIDLISIGNEGLIVAVNKFDPTRGFKLISYAVWWIRQRILQYIENNKQIHIPSNINKYIIMIQRFEQSFLAEHERKPDIFEIQDNFKELSIHLINRILENTNTNVSSLDKPLTNDNDNGLSEILEGNGFNNMEAKYEIEHIKEVIKTYLETVTEREAFIIKNYYGLDTPALSLEDISKLLDISRERVRQINIIFLRKIKRKFKY